MKRRRFARLGVRASALKKGNEVKKKLFALCQYPLPHHLLSRMMGLATHARQPAVKNFFIRQFIRCYRVDMSEALATNPLNYEHFNQFFTRAINSRTFPIAENQIIAPADGAISQIGSLSEGLLLQAKGKSFSVGSLLADEELAKIYTNGRYATIYLSPRDYHRVHMPLGGTLISMRHIPGRLFSVNPTTTATVPNLFARNERVVALFETPAGPMALILVGAIFVASIETVWHGVVTPPTVSQIRTWDYRDDPQTFARGAEMGRFNMGSTVIVLLPANRTHWSAALGAGSAVRMGQILGEVDP